MKYIWGKYGDDREKGVGIIFWGVGKFVLFVYFFVCFGLFWVFLVLSN